MTLLFASRCTVWQTATTLGIRKTSRAKRGGSAAIIGRSSQGFNTVLLAQSYLLLKEITHCRGEVLAVLLACLSAVLLADLSAQERVILQHTTHDMSHTTSDISHTISQHGDTVDNGQETVDKGQEIAHTFYSWSKVVSGTQDMCNEIVKAILDARSGDAQMLADLCDRDGRKAVDIATPLCKTLLLACTQLCGRSPSLLIHTSIGRRLLLCCAPWTTPRTTSLYI